jgi:hypothetical protein
MKRFFLVFAGLAMTGLMINLATKFYGNPFSIMIIPPDPNGDVLMLTEPSEVIPFLISFVTIIVLWWEAAKSAWKNINN